jgi:hypothetical protein
MSSPDVTMPSLRLCRRDLWALDVTRLPYHLAMNDCARGVRHRLASQRRPDPVPRWIRRGGGRALELTVTGPEHALAHFRIPGGRARWSSPGLRAARSLVHRARPDIRPAARPRGPHDLPRDANGRRPRARLDGPGHDLSRQPAQGCGMLQQRSHDRPDVRRRRPRDQASAGDDRSVSHRRSPFRPVEPAR